MSLLFCSFLPSTGPLEGDVPLCVLCQMVSINIQGIKSMDLNAISEGIEKETEVTV